MNLYTVDIGDALPSADRGLSLGESLCNSRVLRSRTL